jgi:hypothetical protein
MDQTTTPETEVGPLDEQGAVNELLRRWSKPEPEAVERPEATPEPEQAQADAPVEADAPEEPAAEADFEFDVGGKKFKLPKALEETLRPISATVKEIEAGATRKFQEAADARKAVEAERAAVAQMRKIAETQADLLADHKAIARRMQAIEEVDIHATDADTLARHNAEYTRLSAARQRIEAAFHHGVQTMQQQEAQALRARQEHAERVVSQRIKGWGPDLQKELAEYAVSRGAPVEALNSITEPWMVEILADASYGRKMREHKATVEKRVVQTQPTLRPGAAASQPRAEKQAAEAMDRLKKSGHPDDAVAALLARSMNRRK